MSSLKLHYFNATIGKMSLHDMHPWQKSRSKFLHLRNHNINLWRIIAPWNKELVNPKKTERELLKRNFQKMFLWLNVYLQIWWSRKQERKRSQLLCLHLHLLCLCSKFCDCLDCAKLWMISVWGWCITKGWTTARI